MSDPVDTFAELDRRTKGHVQAVHFGLESLTAARVAMGSASIPERLGHHFPRLFRKWAAANHRRDEESRRLHEEFGKQVALFESFCHGHGI